MNYHAKSIAQILDNLKTVPDGLSTKEVENRLSQVGKNILPEVKHKTNALKIFISQWKSPLIIILVIAGLISGLLGEFIDMAVIVITAFLNSVIGFIQEFKANRALEGLKKMLAYKALVMRNGQKILIDSSELVPGDILFLEAGDKIQADGRIIESYEFEINESALTGESEAQKKNSNIIDSSAVLSERTNMVYRGTIVSNGRSKVVVTGTGLSSEIGQIASMVIETEESKTPLQKQLSRLGRNIGYIIVVICLLVFVFGIIQKSTHHTFIEMFETSVALAVAAIPEGLVISMTMILAIGMQFILKRKALVRKLLAAETLGSVTVICTDKTGTLTEGIMQLNKIITANDDADILKIRKLNIADEKNQEQILALRVAIMCNDGILQNPESQENEWKFAGDSLDTALVRIGMKVGLQKFHLDNAIFRRAEIPFDSRRKFMATLHDIDHESEIYIKGASDIVMPLCEYYENQGKAVKMSKAKMQYFKEKEIELTKSGLRVIAVAYKKYPKKLSHLSEKEINKLVFTGLLAFSDPLRQDVTETIEIAKQAGIKTIMITGDHRETAKSIAGQVGLPNNDHQVLEGKDLDQMNEEELKMALNDVFVFARVEPKHKIKIVEILKQMGEVVAMTGDGVNDSPALKAADIGVALGSGTDVAKETADLVLLDDSFSTIVAAVEQGRSIYQNIKKVIVYLLSGSLAEVALICASLISGMPLAILPAQILWHNLIQDSFPNLALAFDKGDKENMADKPVRQSSSIFDSQMKIVIGIIMTVTNIILLLIFYFYYKHTGDIDLTRTIVFTSLGVMSQLYIYSVRHMRHMIWEKNIFDNNYLSLAIVFTWFLMIIAVYWPPLQNLLRTVPLGLNEWLIIIICGFLNLFLIEFVKGVMFIIRKKSNKSLTV